MKKYPDLKLWDKDIKKWNDKDYKIFENIKIGILPTVKKNNNDKRLRGQKVIRVSDGKPYISISECRRDNNVHSQDMFDMLKEGIIYKKTF